jgi:hypothetical protein
VKTAITAHLTTAAEAEVLTGITEQLHAVTGETNAAGTSAAKRLVQNTKVRELPHAESVRVYIAYAFIIFYHNVDGGYTRGCNQTGASARLSTQHKI